MADTATVVAPVAETAAAPATEAVAVETPQVQESTETQAPAVTAETTQQPERMTRDDARSRAREIAQRIRQQQAEAAKAFAPSSEASQPSGSAEAEPSVAPDRGQTDTKALPPRDEKGRFVAAQRSEGGETGTPAPETAPVQQADPQAPQQAAPQLVRIDLPEGDIRRSAGGRDHVMVPADLEQFVRWNLNNVVRARELEETRRQLEEANAKLQRRVIEADARQAAEERWRQTPEYQAHVKRYQEILDTHGEEAARVYWDGVQPQLQKLIEEEVRQRVASVEQEVAQEYAARFLAEARQKAVEQLPREIAMHPRFQEVFDRARYLYGADITRREERGERVLPDHSEFAQFLKTEILKDRELQSVIRATMRPPMPAPTHAPVATSTPAAPPQPVPQQHQPQQTIDIEAIKREAIEEFKRQQAEKREQVPPHPMGAVVGASANRPAGTMVAEEQPDLAKMNPVERRQWAHQRARAIARAAGTRRI